MEFMNPRKSFSPLSSILAVSAGAAVFPSNADAAVVSNYLGPITVDINNPYTLNLPGGNHLTIQFIQSSTGNTQTNYIRASFGNLTQGDFGRQTNLRSATEAGNAVAFRTAATGVNWTNATGRTGQLDLVNIIGTKINATGSYLFGPGQFVETKFLLFRFTQSDGFHYSFLQMTKAWAQPGDTSQLYVTFNGWAYEDQPNALIDTAAIVIPEPSTASMAMGGALVLGATGLRRWRKRKSAAKVADII